MTSEVEHVVAAAKLIVDDLEQARQFYEGYFGMTVATHYDYAPEVYEEYMMTFESGPQLALFSPNKSLEQPLAKSECPQVLIMVEDFEALTQRIKSDGHRLHFLTPREAVDRKVAITWDPSGNVVEIYYQPGKHRVGASKLIVNDRQEAEAFYTEIFNTTVDQRLDSAVYDEVILKLDKGALLALFQPLKEAPLPKSMFPSTAFYVNDFDDVIARLDKIGLGYRDVDTRSSHLRIVIARDPAGNAIEIISSQQE